jgi:transposase InsO family protein
LAKRGVRAGRHRIARLLRQNDLGARRRRRFRQTTDSKHSLPCAPNLLRRNFTATAPNRAWVSDVTFIGTKEGWLYLAVILDLFSRKVVGWGMATENDAKLVLRALEMAVASRRPSPGLIFHSDRGSTYAAKDVVAFLQSHEMVPSMSRRGDCWDNAVAESFFASLKVEWLETEPPSIRAAMADVFHYIEMFYNPVRLHSHLGNQSPSEFEATSVR